MDTQSEGHDRNTSHDPDQFNVKNDGSTQGQVIGDYANVHNHFYSSQKEHEPPLPRSSNNSQAGHYLLPEDPTKPHQEDTSVNSRHEQQNASSQETIAIKPREPNPRRPITVFLSYNEQDADEVTILERELKLRGITITDLHKIGSTKRDIAYGITHEVDALLIYLTPESLNSSSIWDTTIPAALERYKSDHSFSIITLLRGLTHTKLERVCASHSLPSLKEFCYGSLPDVRIDQVAFNRKQKVIVNRILNVALRHRLRQTQDVNDHEPCICLRTFKDRPVPSYLDLNLNWCDLFVEKELLPPQIVWQDMLFPALLDVKEALGELPTGRRLHIWLQSIIPAAFALGYVFRGTTSFTLSPWNKETKEEWSSVGPTSVSDPLCCTSDNNEDGDPHVAIVEIAISQPTASAVSNNLPLLGLSYRHRLRFEPPEGPHYKTAVKDDLHARAMALQVGAEFRKLCGEGVAQIHLFAALPVALAVLIGHQFNAICPVTVYEYNTSHRIYKLACTLQAQ